MSLQDRMDKSFQSFRDIVYFVKKNFKDEDIITQYLGYRKNGFSIFHLLAQRKDFYHVYQFFLPYFEKGRENVLSNLLNEKCESMKFYKRTPYKLALVSNNREFVLTFFPFMKDNDSERRDIADFIVRYNHFDLLDLVETKYILRKSFSRDNIQIVKILYEEFGSEKFELLFHEKTIVNFTTLDYLIKSVSHRCWEFILPRYSHLISIEQIKKTLTLSIRKGSSETYNVFNKLIKPCLIQILVESVIEKADFFLVFNLMKMRNKYFDFYQFLVNDKFNECVLRTGYFKRNLERKIIFDTVCFERLLWIYLKQNKENLLFNDFSFVEKLPPYIQEVWNQYQKEPKKMFLEWTQKYDSRKKASDLKQIIKRKVEVAFLDGRLKIHLKRYPKLLRFLNIYFKLGSEDLQDLLLLKVIKSEDYILPDIFSKLKEN